MGDIGEGPSMDKHWCTLQQLEGHTDCQEGPRKQQLTQISIRTKLFFFFYHIHVSQTSRINTEVWMHFGWHYVCLNSKQKLRGTRAACQPDYGPGFLPLLIWTTP